MLSYMCMFELASGMSCRWNPLLCNFFLHLLEKSIERVSVAELSIRDRPLRKYVFWRGTTFTATVRRAVTSTVPPLLDGWKEWGRVGRAAKAVAKRKRVFSFISLCRFPPSSILPQATRTGSIRRARYSKTRSRPFLIRPFNHITIHKITNQKLVQLIFTWRRCRMNPSSSIFCKWVFKIVF